MAFLKHMSKNDIEENYNALALLMGVPVYGKYKLDPEGIAYIEFGGEGRFMPEMQEANWVPVPIYWMACVLTGMWVFAQAPFISAPRMPLLMVKTL